MKKYFLILCTLFVFSANAQNFGTEIKSGVIYGIYQQCNDENNEMAKLANVMNVAKPKWCGCLISQIQQQFEQRNLEERLNQGNITINQFEREMGKTGEKAAEYCVNKLIK
ncbi:hypothetical protein BKK49_10270 [Rodentibacter rarus]|uniref:Uncharacterized protein n=1 Tax=Rodentibacter rarus TaxID=1908260 RepID=A0A1V3IRB8_9PAST|nr:hypothetical protein [Rodentibacter rarus]OOF38162.1 hypothetical protein BKK49_10270 [Rodentibacter rarus]OOF44504.1 hypothetical protein BKK50_02375 [Rodentibacter rarus]